MSDRVAFLNHIAAHPEADLPRLVFADWLEEQGDPLGEFIRIQLELSQRPSQLDEFDTQRLHSREAELLSEFEGAWTDGWGARFERGFPIQVRMDWRDFADHGEQLLDRCPTVRILSIRPANLLDQPILEAPLHRLRSLHLEGWPEPEFLEQLLAAPHWNPHTTLRVNTRLDGRSTFIPLLRDSGQRLEQLELVQTHPGPPIGRYPRLIDNAIEQLVADLNRALGREFTVLIRPYDREYPLSGELGAGFFAGHLKSGAAVLFGISASGRRVAFCTFTEEGRLDKSLWEETAVSPWSLERIRSRFGFDLGLIRVRSFEANHGLAVQFWSRAERAILAGGDWELGEQIGNHLAEPRQFQVSLGERELRVCYRTGRGVDGSTSGFPNSFTGQAGQQTSVHQGFR